MKNLKQFFIIVYLISSVVILFSTEEINSLELFSTVGYQDGFVYFSVLNPVYIGEDKDEKLIFNAAKEVAKFLSVDLAYNSTAFPLGSFYLNNNKIFVDYNTELIGDVLPYIKVTLPQTLDFGVVSVVKISTSNIKELWSKVNTTSCPDYSEVITFVNKNYSEWFFNLPSKSGYIFGLGISDDMSTLEKKFEMSDYRSMVDIINTLSIKVSNELSKYESEYLNLYNLFSSQSSNASIPGIKVIKRYYSEKYGVSYSLSVLRL